MDRKNEITTEKTTDLLLVMSLKWSSSQRISQEKWGGEEDGSMNDYVNPFTPIVFPEVIFTFQPLYLSHGFW